MVHSTLTPENCKISQKKEQIKATISIETTKLSNRAETDDFCYVLLTDLPNRKTVIERVTLLWNRQKLTFFATEVGGPKK
jgi:hypothetical protein